jgi:hypothetical protein
LWQSGFVCGEVDLFVAESAYPRRFHLIQAKTDLSTVKRGYPGQIKLIDAKTTLSIEKSACLAQSGLV